MDYSQTVSNLSEEMINKLTTAIELGRWENGEKLTTNQLESAMQAVILWQAEHVGNDNNEPFVVGRDGGLYTGKGKSHEIASVSQIDDANIIVKNKV